MENSSTVHWGRSLPKDALRTRSSSSMTDRPTTASTSLIGSPQRRLRSGSCSNPNNIGVIPTLQRGLQAARGKYIYFAAADDWVAPGFFELALRRLEADPDVGLFCGEAMLVDGRNNRPFAVRPAVRPRMRAGRIDVPRVRQLLRSTDNWILTGSTIFRRECVDWAGGFDARLGSFADGFIARKIALRYGFYFEPMIVASWVVFPDSVSRTHGTRSATFQLHSRRGSQADCGGFRLSIVVRRLRSATAGGLRRAVWRSKRTRSTGQLSSNWARVPPQRRPNSSRSWPCCPVERRAW